MKISSIKYLLPALLLLSLTVCMGSITPLNDQNDSNITGGSAPQLSVKEWLWEGSLYQTLKLLIIQ